MINKLLTVILLLLTGCDTPSTHTQTFDVAKALGGTSTEGFKTANEIIPFIFPKDHNAHRDYRNEWWYFTGHLKDKNARRYGYQLTFFRIGLIPPKHYHPPRSQWAYHDIWMAHFALTDINNNKHYFKEKFSRGSPGMAGVQLSPFKVWLDNWQLHASDNDFPWHIRASSSGFSLQLKLTQDKPLVLQGDRGLSQKSPNPGNASYYYSYPRLLSTGQIAIDNEQYQVTGLSWFDREWSTSALDEDQMGWDWFALHFEDGHDLMYYQLRNRQGLPHNSSQGKWIDADGSYHTIKPRDITLKPQRYWQADNGARYPVEWALAYQQKNWIVRALLDKQLMKTSVVYWEGAVEVIDPNKQTVLGRGYLEMTGYETAIKTAPSAD